MLWSEKLIFMFCLEIYALVVKLLLGWLDKLNQRRQLGSTHLFNQRLCF